MWRFFKKAAIVACVFAASFIMTVIAFAEVSNPDYLGRYNCEYSWSDAYIQVNEDYVRIFAYFDDKKFCNISGETYDFKLSNSAPDHFYANFKPARRVYSDGTNVEPAQYFYDYKASGNVIVKMGGFLKMFIKEVTIASKESNYMYTLVRF